MAIRPLLRYPDPGLSRRCDVVTHFDAALQALADDLLQTMRAAPGVGITAAHIGVLQRVVVLELAPGNGGTIYVNPEILSSSDETMTHEEGSVSMPGVIETVTRPASIRLSFADLAGQGHALEMQGFAAICMQHEIDQLDGIFWIQRLSRLKRERLLTRWGKRHR